MRKLVAMLVLASMCSASFGQATAVSKVQTLISALVQKKIAARGFAANDPRWGSTLSSTGAALGGAAAAAVTVTAGAATAPAWVTVAIALGMGYAVQLAVDGVMKWVFSSDGKVAIPGTQDNNNVAGGYSPYLMYQISNVFSATYSGVCYEYGRTLTAVYNAGTNSEYKMGTTFINGACYYTNIYKDGSTQVSSLINPNRNTGCVGINLSAVNGACPASNFPTIGDKSYANPGAALADLPATEKAKPANPAIIADLANRAWAQAAAAPGYSGLPYDATNPVTQADVDAYRTASPDSYPTVGDIVSPQVAPSGSPASAPFSLPNTGTDSSVAPTTPTNPSTQPQDNLGPDPNIGMPTLETPPTVNQILDPIFNLMPSLRTFTVPQHTATCPKPTFNLWSKSYTLDAHCDLLDGVKPLLSVMMAFVWAFIGLRITLSA